MDKETEYVYFDLETTARGPDNSPEAHYPVNKIVMCGWKRNGASVVNVRWGTMLNDFIVHLTAMMVSSKVVLVAHNLKFDLKYMLREYPDFPWHELGYIDTMTARYLVGGHKDRFISLEKLCAMYKVSFIKGLDLGAMIKGGIDVDGIDKEELTEYLEADVDALEQVTLAMDKLHNLEQMDMEYILPLAKMELNGLPLDISAATTLAHKLYRTVEDNKEHLLDNMQARLQYELDHSTPLVTKCKPMAPRTMSYLLTGYPTTGLGTGKVKQGALKFSPTLGGPLLSMTDVVSLWGKDKPTHLGFKFTAKIQTELLSGKYGALPKELVEWYKAAKDGGKLLNTYVMPFIAQAKDTGGTVNPKLNTTVTGTGRLSSSAPNGQNCPVPARNLIKSTEGELYEIDFSQLEIVGAATLSRDKQLIADILGGLDIHLQTATSVFGSGRAAGMRKAAKAVNFGVLYGGGVTGLSEMTGLSKPLVKSLIEAFYGRYPGIESWQATVLARVKDSSWVVGTKDGESYKGSTYQLPAIHGGRTFYFEESTSPAWMQISTGKKHSFKPTETKNYPIQGFAGGDIVMGACTVLDHMLASTGAKLRMTVHDSIVVDWEKGKAVTLQGIMNEVCKVIQSRYHIPVPLKFDIDHDVIWQ